MIALEHLFNMIQSGIRLLVCMVLRSATSSVYPRVRHTNGVSPEAFVQEIQLHTVDRRRDRSAS